MPMAISVSLRQAVIARAQSRCEYCRKPPIAFYPHEVDHVIAVKHGGATTLDNLAYACFECNRHKGSDLTSFDPQTGALTRLFNPRTQHWSEHFRLERAQIVSFTPEGRTTVFLLHLNDPERILERAALNVSE